MKMNLFTYPVHLHTIYNVSSFKVQLPARPVTSYPGRLKYIYSYTANIDYLILYLWTVVILKHL